MFDGIPEDEVSLYRRSIGGSVAVKMQETMQETVLLFTCPVCDVKHERVTSVDSFENRLCERHLRLLRQRKAALSALPPWDRPRCEIEYQDLYDHVKWLKVLDGLK